MIIRKNVLSCAVVCALSGITAAASAAPSFELLGSYDTGLSELESSGETVALRKNRMYVTSAEAVALDIVDLSDPANPVLINRVDLSAYGAAVNSVDVSSKNLVAVAVSAANKTDPGTAGCLPSWRGRYLLITSRS